MLNPSIDKVSINPYLIVFTHVSVGCSLAIFLFTTSASFKLLLDLLPTSQSPLDSFRTVSLAKLLICLFY